MSELSDKCKNYGKVSGVAHFNCCERCEQGLFQGQGCAYYKEEGESYLDWLRKYSITVVFQSKPPP